jgi:hypothetical protein
MRTATLAWKFAPLAPIPAEVERVHRPQPIGRSLNVVVHDQRNGRGDLELRARASRTWAAVAVGERLAVERIVIGRVEQRQPAIAQLAGQGDVLRSLGREVDRNLTPERAEARFQRLARAREPLRERLSVPALDDLRPGYAEAENQPARREVVERHRRHRGGRRRPGGDLDDRRAELQPPR